MGGEEKERHRARKFALCVIAGAAAIASTVYVSRCHDAPPARVEDPPPVRRFVPPPDLEKPPPHVDEPARVKTPASADGSRPCADILAKNPKAKSGVYGVLACGRERSVYCDMVTDGGGWTVIDAHRDQGWQSCFEEWRVTGKTAGSPNSCRSWRTWFRGALPEAEFRLSPGCGDVTPSKTSQVLHWTGDNYGCLWWNRNCDFNGECRTCADNYNANRLTGGTCPAQTKGPDDTYCHSCSGDWWNDAPSIGIDGSRCVAYR